MKIAVLGAGAWGTALAINAGAHHQVTLWARDNAQAQAMQAARMNRRYLPDLPFSDGLQVSSDGLGPWLAQQDLVVIGSPMSSLRGVLSQLAPILGSAVPVAWLCKGFEAAQGALAEHAVANAPPPCFWPDGTRSARPSGPCAAWRRTQWPKLCARSRTRQAHCLGGGQ